MRNAWRKHFAIHSKINSARAVTTFSRNFRFFAIRKGSVSGSGTGPGDPGSRGPALPDPETFPYEWLGSGSTFLCPVFHVCNW